MRISRKTQNTIKNVVSAVLAIAILLGVASLIGGLTRADDDERVKVHPTFSVGGLNEVGKYVESEGTIYTKEAFECQGLKIELDFEKTIFYEVFFYDGSGDFLSSVEKSNVNSTPELPNGATHARIVITPDWDLLEITKSKEQVIKWYEVVNYSKQITIKVNEEQKDFIELLEENENVYTYSGKSMYDITTGEFSVNSASPWAFSGLIDCSSANKIIIKIETTELTRKVVFSGKDRFAINMYDVTNEKDLKYDPATVNIIDTSGKFSYVSIDCSNFDSFVFSTSMNVIDTTKVYLLI